MLFPPARRVRKRPEYQSIQKTGRRISTRHFVLIVARSPTPDTPPRLGITASRRVGNSVRRSRLKRIVRAAFQQTNGLLPSGHDLVVICRLDASTMTTQSVVQEWQSVSRRIAKAIKP